MDKDLKDWLDSFGSSEELRTIPYGMSKKRPHETAFTKAEQISSHDPHHPTKMLSANSKGPIKMWACGIPNCGEYEYTYVEGDAIPICRGGLQWSFMTNGIFDPRVHSAKALGW